MKAKNKAITLRFIASAKTHKRLQKVAKSWPCTCGADRTGPTAEAHAVNCPAKQKDVTIK